MIDHLAAQHARNIRAPFYIGPFLAQAFGWLVVSSLAVWALSDGPTRLARHNLDAAALTGVEQ